MQHLSPHSVSYKILEIKMKNQQFSNSVFFHTYGSASELRHLFANSRYLCEDVAVLSYYHIIYYR